MVENVSGTPLARPGKNMSPTDLESAAAVDDLCSRPEVARSGLSRVCLFTGLTGLTSMLFLAGWRDSHPPSAAGDPFATAVAAALLTVAAVFAVARIWPVRPPSPGHSAPSDPA